MKSQKETIKLPGLAAWWGISSQRCKRDLHFRLLPSLVLHHQWDRGGRKKQIQTYNSCPFSCHDLFSSCARSAMEPRIQATTPAMTFSKAGWQILSKKMFFLFHTKWTNLATSRHQVDKMCPGEPEKVFHIDAEFFLNLLLQFPLRLQVIIFVGPINQTSTTYTWFQSLWFLPSFFLSGDPTGSNILQPVGSEAPRTRASWPPPICSRPSQPLSGDHLKCLFPACESDRKEKVGPTYTTLFLRILGSIPHIGYGGPITRTNGPASKW